MKVIGRKAEIEMLRRYMNSQEPEFIAVYGRRRVGKTYLINEFFDEDYAFAITATSDRDKKSQLENFRAALLKYGAKPQKQATTWREAFEQLTNLLAYSPRKGRQVVFFDELPWFDTRKSGFLSAFEHFWNSWAATKPQILLIACGSATSWMINKLIRNKRGLHNRVTARLRLEPFTLNETEQYLIYRDIFWERKDILHVYMALGGIPFYLKMLNPVLSATQNIDQLCFEKDAPMREEFNILYASLFAHPDKHLRILEVLAAHRQGLAREQLLDKAKLSSGGAASEILEELEQCGFIDRFNDISGKNGRYLYQIIDFFTLFYIKNMKGNKHLADSYWAKTAGGGTWNNWAGQTFEKVCLVHINNIRAALSIGGITSTCLCQ